VTDGFCLPRQRASAEWLDADTLLLSSAFGAGMATTSATARTIRRWRRGTDVAEALVRRNTPDNIGVFSNVESNRCTRESGSLKCGLL